jgi:transcriptional adapter 2-alpha
MQVDPIKPTSKPTGTKRLKLKRDEQLSISAFKFNLRRHNEGNCSDLTGYNVKRDEFDPEYDCDAELPLAGRCRLTLSNPRLNRALETKI